MNKRKFSLWRFAFSLLVLALSVSVVAANGEWESFDTEFTMDAVSMVSADYGWAAEFACGRRLDGDVNITKHVLYRWDGINWTVQREFPLEEGECRGVLQMVSKTDGWFGYVVQDPDTFDRNTNLYRWNGSVWTFAGSFVGGWAGFDMLAPDNIWSQGGDTFFGVTHHWDGTQWAFASHSFLDPEEGPSYTNEDISMINDTDGWAIGGFGDINRWNGKEWLNYPSPYETDRYSDPLLAAVDMVSVNDGWIVGDGGLILRWENNSWVEYPSPVRSALYDVEMLNANHGYAVSNAADILHWDGNEWTIVADNLGSYVSLDMIDANNGWAVGDSLARLSGEPVSDGGDMPPAGADDCVIPPSGPWPPCATGDGTAPAPPANNGDCVIPESGPWPPCATGDGSSDSGDCVIPPSGPWPPCATGGVPPTDLPEGCVVPQSGPWPSCARILLRR